MSISWLLRGTVGYPLSKNEIAADKRHRQGKSAQ
jgi:hypothetical protein